jgi:hypothetical protein
VLRREDLRNALDTRRRADGSPPIG